MTNENKTFIIKNRRTICGFLIILILFEVLAVFIMVQNYKENYLSQEDAVSAALNAAGVTAEQITDLDSDFETGDGEAWFEITFVSDETTYYYKVNAETGEVTVN